MSAAFQRTILLAAYAAGTTTSFAVALLVGGNDFAGLKQSFNNGEEL